jgi:hypothetical protein
MPIKILRHESSSEPVKVDLLVSTIETNRDRIRTLGNMLITAAGILISACLAFLLFIVDKGYTDTVVALLLGLAILLFLASTCLSIASSFLRKKFIVLDEAQFVEDLLINLNNELRVSHYAFLSLLAGLVAMISGVLLFVILHAE